MQQFVQRSRVGPAGLDLRVCSVSSQGRHKRQVASSPVGFVHSGVEEQQGRIVVRESKFEVAHRTFP